MKVANSVYFVNRLIKVTFWRLTVIGLHGSHNLLICICIYTYIYIYISVEIGRGGGQIFSKYIYCTACASYLEHCTLGQWIRISILSQYKMYGNIKKWPDHIFRTSITIVIQTWHYSLLFDVTRRRLINKRHSCVLLASFIFE